MEIDGKRLAIDIDDIRTYIASIYNKKEVGDTGECIGWQWALDTINERIGQLVDSGKVIKYDVGEQSTLEKDGSKVEIKGKEISRESVQKLWDFWFDRCTSICDCCEHYVPKYFKCSPETCEYYEEFKDVPEVYSYISNSYRPFTCQDMDFAECRALKETVCKECNNNGLNHFSWNGNVVINNYD